MFFEIPILRFNLFLKSTLKVMIIAYLTFTVKKISVLDTGFRHQNKTPLIAIRHTCRKELRRVKSDVYLRRL